MGTEKPPPSRFPEDTLTQHLQAEARAVEESFDRLCGEDLRRISALHSRIYNLLGTGLLRAQRQNDECREFCACLLFNATHTIMAALEILRRGYTMQPGVLLRNAIETLSTAHYLVKMEDGLTQYRNGTLESPSTIAVAKELFPAYGRWYGAFSEHFAHIGPTWLQVRLPLPYTERSEELDANIMYIKAFLWLTYFFSELPFCDLLPKPLYWNPTGDRTCRHVATPEGDTLKREFTEPADPSAPSQANASER